MNKHRLFLSRMLRRAGWSIPFFLLLAACRPDLSTGLGQSCQADNDCHAAKCLKSPHYPASGVCATVCLVQSSCTAGTDCIGGYCQVPLRVGVALTGNQDLSEGWTSAHVQGLDAAVRELGYVKLDKKFGLIPGDIFPDLEKLSSSNRLILGNTFDYITDFQAAAAKYPDNNYVCVDDGVFMSGSKNFTTYWIHRTESWYLAGQIAAKLAGDGNPIGIISAFINPETVADVNAFTLGVKTVATNNQVIVTHVGFWFDNNDKRTYEYKHNDVGATVGTYFREEYLTAQLADAGCKVIAHLTNTQRSVVMVDTIVNKGLSRNNRTVSSFANDKQYGCELTDSNGNPYKTKTCYGSIYENWQSLYSTLFEQLHFGIFNPTHSLDYDISDMDNTPTGVAINPGFQGNNAGIDSISLKKMQQALARNPDTARRAVFKGPYKTNGQRDTDGNGIPDAVQEVKDGEFLTPTELSQMCWYVDGVFELAKQPDGSRKLQPALVPGGLVPKSTVANNWYEPADHEEFVIPAKLNYRCIVNAKLSAPVR